MTHCDHYSLVLAEFIPVCIWHFEFAHQYPQNAQEEDEIYLKWIEWINAM